MTYPIHLCRGYLRARGFLPWLLYASTVGATLLIAVASSLFVTLIPAFIAQATGASWHWWAAIAATELVVVPAIFV